jgi:poly-gamma-glutamate capsule biosynthesis protein CapA/YwtB (metallophosphatase superfamily)
MSEKSAMIGFVGDLLVDRDDPLSVFAQIQPAIDAPDILFGNMEGSFTDDPHPAPSGGTPLFPGAHNLDVFSAVGFDVLSLANNHIVDAGHAALLENLARLKTQGVATCGAGATLAEARKPAVLETHGLKVAFLAYASVFPNGYEARSNMPGLAPLRSYDLWRPAFDNYHLPGTPPRTQCVFDEVDLANLRSDIANAREVADLVVTSFHWGDFLRPYHLTEMEKKTARLCIDEGADMVVGHHHHILRGMEWYRGKPIIYGLGHFVFDTRLDISDEAKAMFADMPAKTRGYNIGPRKGWPLLPLHPDSRMTMLSWVTIKDGLIDGLGFLPCRLNPEGLVFAVDPSSTEGKEVVDYISKGCTTQGLNARIETDRAVELGGYPTVRVVPLDV